MNKNIKEFLIKKYIEENNRTPKQVEVNFLYSELLEANELLEEEGLLASEKGVYCQANEESSSSKYNLAFEKAFIDLNFLLQELQNAKQSQRDIYSDRLRALKTFNSEYKGLERKLNFSILLSQEDDVFSYEIIEDFKDLSKVDIDRSNILHLDNNRVTIGAKKIQVFSVNLNEVSYSVKHRRGNKIAEQINGSFANITAEDASFFSIESTSSSPDDIVEFVINLSFINERSINELKYITSAIESNSQLSEDCYYSLNGVDFIHVDEYEMSRKVSEDRNLITLNNEQSKIDQKIKAIRLVLRKTTYDFKSSLGYVYNFGLDYIGYIDRSYILSKDSVLYAGPYSIVDEAGEDYNYSIAKIDKGTCCDIPNKTSIDIYLSKDNVNFIRADFNKEHNPIVQFGNNWGDATSFKHFSLINPISENDFILDTNELSLNISEDQDIINLFVPAGNSDKVHFPSLKIKRNLLNKSKNGSQDGLYTGWTKDGNMFSCTFECKVPEGRIVDFGDQDEFILDKQNRSGPTFIKYGKHTIKIAARFFNNRIVEKDIKSVRELRKKCTNYPFDHRFLIEGFDYQAKFKGARVFLGFESQRATDLKITSLENLKRSNSLSEYAKVSLDDATYFVVNKESGFGKQEEFAITYRANLSEDGNLLYIKAILKTKDPRRAPKIDKIQVRVL